MLNTLFNAVKEVLTGPNYLEWADNMEAYLQLNSQWSPMTKTKPSTSSDADKAKSWDDTNTHAMGSIKLCLTPSICTAVAAKTMVKQIWDYLKEMYGKPSIPTIYQDFRAAINLTIPTEANPITVLDQLESHFQQLITNKFDVPQHIQGMMLMSKLPLTMDTTIQVYMSGLTSDATTTALQKITLASVHNAIIMHWEQCQGWHQTRGNNNIRKISTVKRKGPDPTFHQQQYHPHPQQQSNQQHPQGQQQNRSGHNCGTRTGCG